MDDITQAKKSRLVRAALFLLCAVPGLILLLYSSLALIFIFFDPSVGVYINPFLYAGGVIFGLILILIGVGKWGQWRYSLVFLSIPVSLLLVFSLELWKVSVDELMVGSIVGIVAFFTLYLVKRSYHKSGQSKGGKWKE
jgi:peptidoglycan/LPS O-acetylase OafA/YrhL